MLSTHPPREQLLPGVKEDIWYFPRGRFAVRICSQGRNRDSVTVRSSCSGLLKCPFRVRFSWLRGALARRQLTPGSSATSRQRFSTAENQALGPNTAHPYYSLNPQMSISSECRQWSAWSNQKMTDHFLQPTQELHNSNNFALMWAWAATEMIALKCKDPSFSSNASNHETSHNSLCRLAN